MHTSVTNANTPAHKSHESQRGTLTFLGNLKLAINQLYMSLTLQGRQPTQVNASHCIISYCFIGWQLTYCLGPVVENWPLG